MLHRTALLISLSFIFHQYCKAQYVLQLDSVQKVYDTIPESNARLKTISYLFNCVDRTNPELAKKYALEEIQLATKLDKVIGIGMGHYHMGSYYSDVDQLDSARFHYEQALSYFKEGNSARNQGLALSALAFSELDAGNYEEAHVRTDSVIRFFESNNDIYRAAFMHGIKSDIYKEQGKYLLALDEALRNFRVMDTINRPLRRAESLMSLSYIEFLLENYPSSLNYANQAKEAFTEFDDNVSLTSAVKEIGDCHLKLGNYDSAIANFDRAIRLAREFEIAGTEADAHSGLGTVYYEQKDLTKATLNYEKALMQHQEIEFRKAVAEDLVGLGLVRLEQKQYQSAISYLDRSIEIFSDMGANNELADAYQHRSLAFERSGRTARSLSDYKAFQVIKDSVLNTAKVRQIEELRTIHEIERKEQQIVNQQNEIALLHNKAQVNRLQNTLLASGLLAMLLLFGFGIYAYKQRMKRNQLAKEKLDAELEYKKKELTSHALHLAQKNEVLEELKEKVQDLRHSENQQRSYNQLVNTINFNLQEDNNWENFKMYFEEVHKDFNSNVKQKYPDVTSNELRLMALMKMNLSSKEIANILNVSNEGVKKARYRLRKKMQIASDDSLQDQILGL